MPARILVTGATGKQGGATADALLKSGFRVRALVREPAKPAAQALAARGCELAPGDLDDSAALRQALAGVDGIFTYGVYSAQAAHEAGGGNVAGEVRQGSLLADLAAEAKIGHLVYGSVGSADRHTGVPHFDTKGEVERHLATLPLPATILRPVFFMQNWERQRASILQTGVLAQPLKPTTRHQQIAVQDIGAFAARVFAAPERWIGRAIDLAGDALTMEETVAAMSRVSGRPIRYVQMPWPDFETRLGRESTLMFRFFDETGFHADPAALRAEVPSALTLEAYLRAAGWDR
ncbi:MAG TPA: NmrA/HSCARG family protein [Stellaceae bacterium]|jgi:uncharacterized protein YbjT (DUF2867 family)